MSFWPRREDDQFNIGIVGLASSYICYLDADGACGEEGCKYGNAGENCETVCFLFL